VVDQQAVDLGARLRQDLVELEGLGAQLRQRREELELRRLAAMLALDPGQERRLRLIGRAPSTTTSKVLSRTKVGKIRLRWWILTATLRSYWERHKIK
jgi:hypothetical protein